MPVDSSAWTRVVEPSEGVHRVARNPSTKTKTKVLAVILHPRDAKEVTTPAEA
jgi:hypothetical protein